MLFVLALTICLALITGAIGVVVFLFINTRNKIGYVTMPEVTLAAVIEALDLTSKSVLIDLGAGDGRLLAAARRSEPELRAIGYENNPFLRHPRGVEWHRSDLLAAGLSEATHVTAYLTPVLNAKLAAKFEREAGPKTIILTVQYELPGWTPKRVIEVAGAPAHAGKVFVYQMAKR